MQLGCKGLYIRIWKRAGRVPLVHRDPASLIAAAEAVSQAINDALDGFESHPKADGLRRQVWEEMLDVLIGQRGHRQLDATDLAIMCKRPLSLAVRNMGF